MFNELTTVNWLLPTPVVAATFENDCRIEVPKCIFCLGNKASWKTDSSGPVLQITLQPQMHPAGFLCCVLQDRQKHNSLYTDYKMHTLPQLGLLKQFSENFLFYFPVVEGKTSCVCHLFSLYSESLLFKVINPSVYNRTADRWQLHITSLIEIINLEWRNGRHFLNGQKKRRLSLAICWQVYHQRLEYRAKKKGFIFCRKKKCFITAINHQVRDMSKRRFQWHVTFAEPSRSWSCAQTSFALTDSESLPV